MEQKSALVDKRPCDECGVGGARLKCSTCKVARYCSRACQKAAWKGHKQACSAPGNTVESTAPVAAAAPANENKAPLNEAGEESGDIALQAKPLLYISPYYENLTGVFELQAEAAQGRPTFKKPGQDIFLFYATNGAWYVGPHTSAPGGWWKVESAASTPGAITEAWTMHDGNGWVEVSAARVVTRAAFEAAEAAKVNKGPLNEAGDFVDCTSLPQPTDAVSALAAIQWLEQQTPKTKSDAAAVVAVLRTCISTLPPGKSLTVMGIDARLRLATTLICDECDKDYKGALSVCDDTLACQPSVADGWFFNQLVGECHAQLCAQAKLGPDDIFREHGAQCIAPLEKAIALKPTDANSHCLLCDIFILLDAPATKGSAQVMPRFMAAYDKFAAQCGTAKVGWFMHRVAAQGFHETRDFAAAAKAYSTALSTMTRDTDDKSRANVMMFGALSRAQDDGNYMAAIPMLQQAALLDPGCASIQSNLSVALQRAGLGRAAAGAIRNPSDAPSLFNTGCALAQAGDQAGAEAAYRMALDAPDEATLDSSAAPGTFQARAHYNLGNIEFQRGNREAAIAEMRSCVEKNSLHAKGHNALGAYLMLGNEFEAAKQSLLKSISVDANHGDVSFTFQHLGSVYCGESNFPAAMASFREAGWLELKRQRLSSKPIRELRSFLTSNGVRHSHCIEKQELLDLCAQDVFAPRFAAYAADRLGVILPRDTDSDTAAAQVGTFAGAVTAAAALFGVAQPFVESVYSMNPHDTVRIPNMPPQTAATARHQAAADAAVRGRSVASDQ